MVDLRDTPFEQAAELHHMTVKSIKDWEYQLDQVSKASFEYLKNRQSATLGRKCINDNANLLEYYNNVRKTTQVIR